MASETDMARIYAQKLEIKYSEALRQVLELEVKLQVLNDNCNELAAENKALREELNKAATPSTKD